MSKIYVVKSGDTLSKIATKLEVSLQELLESNPAFKINPNLIKVGNKIIIPDKEPIIIHIEEPLAVVDVKDVSINVEKDDSKLGSLSAKYEVGNRGGGTVSTGIGDAGGASYGSYQMTSKPNGGTVARFIAQLGSFFRDKFKGLVPGTSAYTKAWKDLYEGNPEDFQKLQHDYIKKTHYDILVNKIISETGLNPDQHSDALRNVIWSTAVQHGGNTSIPTKAIKSLGLKNYLDKDYDLHLIKAIYAERGRRGSDGNLAYFSRNSKDVQKGVANRFVNEQKDALKMLG